MFLDPIGATAFLTFFFCSCFFNFALYALSFYLLKSFFLQIWHDFALLIEIFARNCIEYKALLHCLDRRARAEAIRAYFAFYVLLLQYLLLQLLLFHSCCFFASTFFIFLLFLNFLKTLRFFYRIFCFCTRDLKL